MVVYSAIHLLSTLANLHRGLGGATRERDGGGPHGLRAARAGGHNHMRERLPRPRLSPTSFIAIDRADRSLPHRVEMLSLSARTHCECNERPDIRIHCAENIMYSLNV